MNLKEFTALKKGDRVRNDMTQSVGEVTALTSGGVTVKWGTMEFNYYANSTSFFNWSLVQPECGTCGAVGGHSAACPEAPPPNTESIP